MYLAIAIAGFAAFAAVAWRAAKTLDARGALAAAGAARAVTAGAIAYGTGTVIFLGGHRAVGLLATHRNPIQATNSISFTIDTIDQAFDLAAYALFWRPARPGLDRAAAEPASRAGYTGLLSLLALVIAWSYAYGGGDLTNDLLFAGGSLPGWLIWTARLSPPAPSTRPADPQVALLVDHGA